MNLFRMLALTRTRLVIVTAVFLALFLGLAIPVGDYLRDSSESPVLNMFILMGMAFLMLASATFLAIFVGDFIFPNRWRERVILGREIESKAPDDSLAALRGYKRYFVQYSALIVLFILGGVVSVEALTGGLFSSNQFRSATLRGGSDEAKTDLIRELVTCRNEIECAASVEAIDKIWRNPRQSETVRSHALAALGRVVLGFQRGADHNARRGKEDSYQLRLLMRFQGEIGRDLQRAYAEDEGALRDELLFVLGTFADPASAETFWRILETEEDSTTRWTNAMIGIGRIGDPSYLRRVAGYIKPTRSEAAHQAMAWTVYQLSYAYFRSDPHVKERRIPEVIRQGLEAVTAAYTELLKAPTPIPLRCVATLGLMYTRDSRMREPLKQAFDAPGAAEAQCKSTRIELAPAVVVSLDDKPYPLKARLVDTLNTVASGDDDVYFWYKRRLALPDVDSRFIKDLITDALKQLDRNKNAANQ